MIAQMFGDTDLVLLHLVMAKHSAHSTTYIRSATPRAAKELLGMGAFILARSSKTWPAMHVDCAWSQHTAAQDDSEVY
jgi:hypothetical protein